MKDPIQKQRDRRRRKKILRLAWERPLTRGRLRNAFPRPLQDRAEETAEALCEDGVLCRETVGPGSANAGVKYRVSDTLKKAVRRRRLRKKVRRKVSHAVAKCRLEGRHDRAEDPDTVRAEIEPERQARAAAGKSVFTVATNELARDGARLRIDGLDTSAFEQNPVVLWDHGQDDRRGAEPIGRATSLRKRGGELVATVEWAEDEFAQRIAEKVENGYLNAASLGFDAQEIDRHATPPEIARSEMLEFSIVSVPADTGALVKSRATAHA
ncbi:HK97 family phage prohead protease [Salinibacter ruber]|uniref:HK97 family phage prohead protease n=1 Tax=Salinibacter ruber TaxID=146919 RepID=UPI00216A2D32|nr:HK97 family phage prohead protease [Salinibacter ruber]